MQLKRIEKIVSGKFITRYNLHYKTECGNEKVYEIVSRQEDFVINERKSQAVIILAFNKDVSKICVNREFRLAVNTHIYNFPAGLIDAGETAEEAAIRELREETGLKIVKILDILPPVCNAIGISNEMGNIVFCIADGIPVDTREEDEEIMPSWVDKEEAGRIYTQMCTSQTQLFLYLWSHNLLNLEEVKK